MRDLTDRALDTASAQGATYADVRVVRRLDESISIKTGRVEGVASGESEGFGVRVLVDGAWGFAASHILTAGRGRPRRRRGRPDRPGQRDRPPRPDPARRPPAGPRHVRDAGRGGPVHGPARDARSPTSSPPTRPRSRVKGIAFTESMYAAQREWKTFAATDGSLTEQIITHVGARRSRPTPSTATSTSAGATRTPAAAGGGGGYEFVRGLAPRRAGGAARRGGRRAADRAAVPVGPVHDHPRPEPALPPGPRVVRPPDRARPRLRHRGVVRGDQLPDHRQARRGLPLRLRPDRHRRRRDGARRDGHVRLGRRGRRRAGRAARQGRDLRRLPVVAARPRRGSAARAAARCGPTAGTASRSSG